MYNRNRSLKHIHLLGDGTKGAVPGTDALGTGIATYGSLRS